MNSSKITKSSWLISIVAVVMLGTGAVIYAGITAGKSVQTSLLERTDALAELIPASTISSFSGSQADTSKESYQDLKARLKRLQEKNHDIRFIYLLGKRDSKENSFFFVDSEDPGSEDYSYPGQEYPEGNKDVATIYASKQGTILPVTRDRWGVWLSAFSPIKDERGNVVAVLGLDIPALNYYQHVVATAAVPLLLSLLLLFAILWSKRRAAYQQQYLSEKAFFLSFASHEIRSPLTSVSWALTELKNGRVPKERTSVFLARTQSSIGHILETIEDVMNVQSTESLQTNKLSKTTEAVHSVLQQTIDSLSLVSAEHQCEIIDKTNPHDYNHTADIDARLLKRVFSNFLINAMKYSPSHSPVTVRFFSTRSGWSVSFHNSGEPLSNADKEKIFGGFYRTSQAEKSQEKGTGLGLMLSKEIVERHGGTVALTSNKKSGTTFTVTIPN